MAPAKKKCVGCGKLIPSGALDCVFCRARQPDETADELLVEGQRASTTDETRVGFSAGEMAGAQAGGGEPAHNGADASAGTNGGGASTYPAQTRNTAMMQAIVVEGPAAAGAQPARAEPEATPADVARAPAAEEGRASELVPERPYESLGRTVMGTGGAVLIVLFFMPWHGVSSWRLLDTLVGADFARQLFYLMGGLVLLATAALPVPFTFRGVVGAAVAALPVFLGASGTLDGWRSLAAGLAVLGLAATHLLGAHAKARKPARTLVWIAVASVAMLYLAPAASRVPLAQVFQLIGSGHLVTVVIGIVVLVPPVLAGLSLLGLFGRDLTDVGLKLSVLCLLWAPVVVALRGLMLEDGTQLYVALALLWASATSAVSLAQLLSLLARAKSAAS